MTNDFVDRLALEFDIADRGGLFDAFAAAEFAYQSELLWVKGGEWAEDEAAALDRLADDLGPLWETIRLVREHFYPIAKAMGENEDVVLDFCNRLADVGRAAAAAPRRRHGRGGHHTENAAVRAAVKVLWNYWCRTLGRQWRQDQRWNAGPGGTPAPITKSDRFAYAVIEHIAPGKGKALKTIAREF